LLNTFAKFLLVSTSLAPILGAVAINQFARDEPWSRWVWWLIAGLVLVIFCWAMLRYAAKNAQKHLFHIKDV
jgi:MFS family permease